MDGDSTPRWDGLEIIDIPPGHPLHPGNVCEWWVPFKHANGVLDADFCAAPVSGRRCRHGHARIGDLAPLNSGPAELS
jgi:hypothetical protein